MEGVSALVVCLPEGGGLTGWGSGYKEWARESPMEAAEDEGVSAAKYNCVQCIHFC